MLSSIKNNWKKAEAAAVIQVLLENQEKCLMFTGNAAVRANEIVGACWERAPDLLNGSRGPRPTKYGLSAISLADAIKFKTGSIDENMYLLLALRELFDGLSAYSVHANLNVLDLKLLEIANDAYEDFFSEAKASSRE